MTTRPPEPTRHRYDIMSWDGSFFWGRCLCGWWSAKCATPLGAKNAVVVHLASVRGPEPEKAAG